MTQAPEGQWWSINGQALLDALKRAHDGDNAEIVYMELFVNSDIIEVENEEES